MRQGAPLPLSLSVSFPLFNDMPQEPGIDVLWLVCTDGLGF